MAENRISKMTGKFTDRLYLTAKPYWETIHKHPFLMELKDGTLDERRFVYYLKQDYLYLIDYAKMFAAGSMKACDLETMAKFAGLLNSTLNVEMGLHRQYASRFGVTEEELERTVPSPTTIAYTKYLLSIAAEGSLANITAALLPCMWSYREIGKALVEHPGALEHPLYRDWILTYSSEGFDSLTEWCIGLMDRLAEGLTERELVRLEEQFVYASRLEYLFWEMAYRQEEWPL